MTIGRPPGAGGSAARAGAAARRELSADLAGHRDQQDLLAAMAPLLRHAGRTP